MRNGTEVRIKGTLVRGLIQRAVKCPHCGGRGYVVEVQGVHWETVTWCGSQIEQNMPIPGPTGPL